MSSKWNEERSDYASYIKVGQIHFTVKSCILSLIRNGNRNKRCGCQPKEDLLPSRSIPKGQPLTFPLKEPTVTQTSRILASLVLESEVIWRAPLYDDDEIDLDHDKSDTFKPWSTSYSDTDILSLIHLSGDEDLQSRLRTLCTELADIFSNDLPKEPADIPPFNLIVNDTKWKVGKNRAPPRSQSSVKQTLISHVINLRYSTLCRH